MLVSSVMPAFAAGASVLLREEVELRPYLWGKEERRSIIKVYNFVVKAVVEFLHNFLKYMAI